MEGVGWAIDKSQGHLERQSSCLFGTFGSSYPATPAPGERLLCKARTFGCLKTLASWMNSYICTISQGVGNLFTRGMSMVISASHRTCFSCGSSHVISTGGCIQVYVNMSRLSVPQLTFAYLIIQDPLLASRARPSGFIILATDGETRCRDRQWW